MREQADRVEEALARRIAETEEATRRLEDELKAVRNRQIRECKYETVYLFRLWRKSRK